MDSRSWLVASCGLAASLWMPYVLHRMIRLGIPRALGNPTPADLDEQAKWAGRAQRAHANTVENLAVFAPLLLLAIQLGLGSHALVETAAMTFFFARAAHYLFYTVGVPALRTLAFLVGFGAEVALVIALIGAGSMR